MAELSQWPQGATRELLIAGYREEAARFIANAGDIGLKRLRAVFEDFPAFYRRWRKTLHPAQLLPKAADPAGMLISPQNLRDDPKWAEISRLAQIAGACRVFHGWELPVTDLKSNRFEEYVEQRLRRLLDTRGDAAESALAGLQVGDALRVISLLALAGMIAPDHRDWRQLSLAASAANKELEGIHSIPRMVPGEHSNRSRPTIQFDTRVELPLNVVLIDNAPGVAKLYEWFNTARPHQVLAINEDFDVAMKGLPALLHERDFGLRNAIAGIHIDHRMIPDPGAFIASLRPVLEERASVLLSVGAGDTLEDFDGRIAVMEALAGQLAARGLHPVRLRLFEGESRDVQRSQPIFGLPPLATFEVLYCSLNGAA